MGATGQSPLGEYIQKILRNVRNNIEFYFNRQKKFLEIDDILAGCVTLIASYADKYETLEKQTVKSRRLMTRGKKIKTIKEDRVILSAIPRWRGSLDDVRRQVYYLEGQVLEMDIAWKRSRAATEPRLKYLDDMLRNLRRAGDAIDALERACLAASSARDNLPRKPRRLNRRVRLLASDSSCKGEDRQSSVYASEADTNIRSELT